MPQSTSSFDEVVSKAPVEQNLQVPSLKASGAVIFVFHNQRVTALIGCNQLHLYTCACFTVASSAEE